MLPSVAKLAINGSHLLHSGAHASCRGQAAYSNHARDCTTLALHRFTAASPYPKRPSTLDHAPAHAHGCATKRCTHTSAWNLTSELGCDMSSMIRPRAASPSTALINVSRAVRDCRESTHFFPPSK